MGKAEVGVACRYASFELNGFPSWFPELFEAYPASISKFLLKEIQWELSVEDKKADTHYLLNDVSWSGQWAWNYLGSSIYDLLKKEPINLSNLDRLLNILQGSKVPNDNIEKLAARKCRTLKSLNHLARWFVVWVGVAPDEAIPNLRDRLANLASLEDKKLLAMVFVTHVLGNRRGVGTPARQQFQTPEHLKSLYLLMDEYIRPDEDIDRIGKGFLRLGYAMTRKTQGKNCTGCLAKFQVRSHISLCLKSLSCSQ